MSEDTQALQPRTQPAAWPRMTIRLRLTLLYGVTFLMAGALLLTINYAFVRRSLEHEVIAVEDFGDVGAQLTRARIDDLILFLDA